MVDFPPEDIRGYTAHQCDRAVAWAVQETGARTVADLGAGIARDLKQLFDSGFIEFGYGVDSKEHGHFDIDKVKLSTKQREHLYLESGDYHKVLAFKPPQPFDLCFSNNVLEHVSEPEDMLRVSLSPKAFHVVPHERANWDEQYHRHAWTLEEFRALCGRCGTVVECDQIAPGDNMFALIERRS